MKRYIAVIMSMVLLLGLALSGIFQGAGDMQTVSAAEPVPIVYGDLTRDGQVSLEDAQMALRAALRMIPMTDTIQQIMDVDGNQRADLSDVQSILRKALHIIDKFPIEESGVQPPEEITEPENTQQPAQTEEPNERKTLIVYFSWSSNTEKMAKTIQEKTNGTLYEIVPQNPYPENYTRCTEVALEERDSNARPPIQNLPESIEEYDRILVGYPIWWHTAPMIIGTFLEHYDLTGVDIYPFTQSASMNTEQFDNSMAFIRECAKGADVHDGLFTRAANTSEIEAYLIKNGLAD